MTGKPFFNAGSLDFRFFPESNENKTIVRSRPVLPELTFVMGPETLGRCPELPETEASGLGPLNDGLDLKGVMLWETPAARVNCSRSATLARPLAVWRKGR